MVSFFLNNGLFKAPFFVVLCHKHRSRFNTSPPPHPSSFSHSPPPPSPPHSFHFFNLESKTDFCNLIDCLKQLRRYKVKSSIYTLSDRLCFPTIGYNVTAHQKSPTADTLHTHTHPSRSQLMPLFPSR